MNQDLKEYEALIFKREALQRRRSQLVLTISTVNNSLKKVDHELSIVESQLLETDLNQAAKARSL